MWLRVVCHPVLPGRSPVRRLRSARMAAPGGAEHRDERRLRSGSSYGLGIMSSIRRITSLNTPDISDGGIDGGSNAVRDEALDAVQSADPDDEPPSAPPPRRCAGGGGGPASRVARCGKPTAANAFLSIAYLHHSRAGTDDWLARVVYIPAVLLLVEPRTYPLV